MDNLKATGRSMIMSEQLSIPILSSDQQPIVRKLMREYVNLKTGECVWIEDKSEARNETEHSPG